MTTWEERMADAARARQVVREAEALTEQATRAYERTPAEAACDAAFIAARAADLTPEAAADGEPWACACVGQPPGCSLCYCHLEEEARARVLCRPCRWCAR